MKRPSRKQKLVRPVPVRRNLYLVRLTNSIRKCEEIIDRITRRYEDLLAGMKKEEDL